MTKRLKIQDLDNFQEDLSQELATDSSQIQGGMLAATTDSVALEDVSLKPSDGLTAYPLPEEDPKFYPLPWPPYPCCCYPLPYKEEPVKPIQWDGGEITDIKIWPCYCPVVL